MNPYMCFTTCSEFVQTQWFILIFHEIEDNMSMVAYDHVCLQTFTGGSRSAAGSQAAAVAGGGGEQRAGVPWNGGGRHAQR